MGGLLEEARIFGHVNYDLLGCLVVHRSSKPLLYYRSAQTSLDSIDDHRSGNLVARGHGLTPIAKL